LGGGRSDELRPTIVHYRVVIKALPTHGVVGIPQIVKTAGGDIDAQLVDFLAVLHEDCSVKTILHDLLCYAQQLLVL
jgi:hypothetical protein